MVALLDQVWEVLDPAPVLLRGVVVVVVVGAGGEGGRGKAREQARGGQG